MSCFSLLSKNQLVEQSLYVMILFIQLMERVLREMMKWIKLNDDDDDDDDDDDASANVDYVYLPFELQVEIIRRLPVKSLIQFRSVSKPWKSLIDSPNFVAGYRGQLQHLFVSYVADKCGGEGKYVLLVDDDTFPQQKASQTLPSTLVDRGVTSDDIIGCSHGLLCFFCYLDCNYVAFLWNISVRKAVAIAVPNVESPYGLYTTVLGFGVCGETADTKLVKINQIRKFGDAESISCIPRQVEVFALSTRAWRKPYGSNLPRKSIHFGLSQVVIDGSPYWLALDESTVDGKFWCCNLIISFDMTMEEFKEINLPHSLADQHTHNLSLSKLRESLVVLERGLDVCFVWMMENSGVFAKVFTIDVIHSGFVAGFRQSGELIVQIDNYDFYSRQLCVYDPYSRHVVVEEEDNIGIHGMFFVTHVDPYMETLLLLDQKDFIVSQ